MICNSNLLINDMKVFIIIILFIIYNYFRFKNNIRYISMCKWKALHPQNISVDKEYTNTTKYINILNKLNIFYYLSFGSELAAYRDGSKKKNDHDIDINIPVWKNYKIFRCNSYVMLNESIYHKRNVHLYENFTLCGKKRKDYINIMKNYLTKKWEKYNILINTFPLSLHVYLFYNPTSFPLHYDFWICMANEYVYRDLNLCITHFQNTLAIIPSNPHNHLQLLYGNYLIKSGKSASDGYPIYSPFL